MTKYGYDFSKDALKVNIGRLTNQLWKLIPMRENNEAWDIHLTSLIVEIAGLGKIYNNNLSIISLLSKLEGLNAVKTDFSTYRKTVFETITLLQGVIKNDQ